MFENTQITRDDRLFCIDYTYIVINQASEIVRTRTKCNFSARFAIKKLPTDL